MRQYNCQIKRFFLSLLYIMIAFPLLFSQNILEGSTAVAMYGQFPASGYYAATNAFPRNSIITVEHPRTGKTVELIVSDRLRDPGLFLVISREAAEELGLRETEVLITRVYSSRHSSRIADPTDDSRTTLGVAAGPSAELEASEGLKFLQEYLAGIQIEKDEMLPDTVSVEDEQEFRDLDTPAYIEDVPAYIDDVASVSQVESEEDSTVDEQPELDEWLDSRESPDVSNYYTEPEADIDLDTELSDIPELGLEEEGALAHTENLFTSSPATETADTGVPDFPEITLKDLETAQAENLFTDSPEPESADANLQDTPELSLDEAERPYAANNYTESQDADELEYAVSELPLLKELSYKENGKLMDDMEYYRQDEQDPELTNIFKDYPGLPDSERGLPVYTDLYDVFVIETPAEIQPRETPLIPQAVLDQPSYSDIRFLQSEDYLYSPELTQIPGLEYQDRDFADDSADYALKDEYSYLPENLAVPSLDVDIILLVEEDVDTEIEEVGDFEEPTHIAELQEEDSVEYDDLALSEVLEEEIIIDSQDLAKPDISGDPVFDDESEVVLVPVEERPPEGLPIDEALLKAFAESFEQEITALQQTVPKEETDDAYEDTIETEEPEKVDVVQDYVETPFEDLPAQVQSLEPGVYYVQLATFANQNRAVALSQDLGRYYPVTVLQHESAERFLYQVLVGPIQQDEAGALLLTFRYSGFHDAFVRIGN